MPDFSIQIVPVAGGFGFKPDLPGSQTGDPLSCPPSSVITWANLTGETHQIQTDDSGYTSNDILPQMSVKPDYIGPATDGSYGYHCTKHQSEKGTIVVQAVQQMAPITPIVAALAALATAALLALPMRAQTPQPVPPPATATSQIPCLAESQPLVKIPEIISKDGRLRATLISTTEQVRMPSRYPTQIDTKPSQPGDPQTFHACFPEWVRAFRSPDTTTPWPGQTKGYLDPMNGPTLRARVGDVIELTYLNQIDPLKFGESIDKGDQAACDSTSVGYPGGAGDTFPNCFHGSTTGNIHFHGTHTNPTSTGDNVFLEILSSKRLTGQGMPPPPPLDDFFAQCEAHLAMGSHVEWPVKWSDLPTTFTDMQKQWLQTFDEQMKKANLGQPLWPVNQHEIDDCLFPQYYIGAFPYCFKLPQYPETVQVAATGGKAGSAEMEAHQGMDAVNQQGGALKMGQSPGTHWYHAHKHGSTTIDLSNGFSGAFIIEGLYDDQINEVYKAFGPQWTRTQPVLVINQFGTSPNLKGGAGQDKGPDFEVNGRVNPVIAMKPGEVQMWRVVNTSGRAGALFIGPPAGFSWRKLAVDGVQLHPTNYAKSLNQQFLLAAGNRVDLLVQAPAAACTTKGGCVYPVQVHNEVDPSDLVPATPPARGPFKINLMSVNVSGNPVQMPFPDSSPASTFPDDLKDITDGDVQGTQNIAFGTVPQQFNNGAPPRSMAAIHTINGKKFSNEVGVAVLLNKVEEWTVTNNSAGISHPFHIHINPFQITQVFAPASATLPDGTTPRYVATTDPNQPLLPGQCRLDPTNDKTWVACPADPGYSIPQPRIWWDVFPIPSALVWTSADQKQTVNIKGYFKMRSRFVDYPGWFVIHCHILAHEDRGMMTVVEVTPLLSKYSHH
jgi:FtsP/CotA-like multicopper oxidase with cupredoxin domain/plastocyanin